MCFIIITLHRGNNVVRLEEAFDSTRVDVYCFHKSRPIGGGGMCAHVHPGNQSRSLPRRKGIDLLCLQDAV